MPGVGPSRMGEALRAAGLDPKNLPPLETLDPRQRLHVMRTFTSALGGSCFDCHAEGDWAADTRRKRVAKRMWNEITRVFVLESGAPLYCDSCHRGTKEDGLASTHEGQLFTIDRSDRDRVGSYMSEVFVGQLKRADGEEHKCSGCHGSPPDFKFLSAWKSSPAPDIEAAK